MTRRVGAKQRRRQLFLIDCYPVAEGARRRRSDTASWPDAIREGGGRRERERGTDGEKKAAEPPPVKRGPGGNDLAGFEIDSIVADVPLSPPPVTEARTARKNGTRK